MSKYIKPKFEDSDLGLNPFVTNLVVRVNKRVFKNVYKKINGEDIPNIAEVEYDKFCKIYTDAYRRDMMNTLSVRGKELLFWIMFQLQGGKDYIWINREMYMDECGMTSENTFLSAVKDLSFKGFLARTVIGKDVYWINPDLFFKGDRVGKYKNKIEQMNLETK